MVFWNLLIIFSDLLQIGRCRIVIMSLSNLLFVIFSLLLNNYLVHSLPEYCSYKKIAVCSTDGQQDGNTQDGDRGEFKRQLQQKLASKH